MSNSDSKSADSELADRFNVCFVPSTVHVAGDTVTYGRLADIVEAVLGHRVNGSPGPFPLAEELGRDPGNALKKYRAVFAAGHGVAWDMSTKFNASRRLAVTDVMTWAAANLLPPHHSLAARGDLAVQAPTAP